MSGKSQGNVREFCSVLSVGTLNKSLCLYSVDDCNSHSFEKEDNNSVSISGRLVSKKSESSNPSKGQTVYPSIDHVLGLGLVIFREKSELNPAQTFVFIRMEFLTVENIVRIPLDKVQSVLEFLNWFLKQSSVSARVFLSLLGQLNATAQFVILGRLHLCPLQMALFAQWKPHVLPLTHKILISHQIKHHLKWWTNRDWFIQGVPVKPVQETHTLLTDASVSSLGAHLEPEGLLFHGVWTNDQSQLDINVLEMMAISMALERAHHVIHNTTVMIATVSASVVSYIIKQGGLILPPCVWRFRTSYFGVIKGE